jgi:lipopolysaccharide/colanic/teichoic acid biosynthesis glycosyltransferase
MSAGADGATSKRVMDVIVATGSLLILIPFLPLVALLIKLDSPGSAFYRRRVLGRGNKPFDAFKFRTMYANGDAILAARPELSAELRREGKLKDDPRVTPLGRWLRRLSIDELPQLVNVLRGEMSMVGPRMISPAELERFGPYAEELLTVRPGITGLWQVSGRADLPYQDRVLLNVRYIRTRTLWMDVKLLLLTLPTVFTKKGAY